MYPNDPKNDQEPQADPADAILTQPTLAEIYDAIDPLEGLTIQEHDAK